MSTISAVVFENVTLSNCFVAFALGWCIYCWLHNRLLNLPPGPIGLPLLGSIPYLQLNAEKTFASWIEKYGPIISVQLGADRTVVLNNIEAIEEVTMFLELLSD